MDRHVDGAQHEALGLPLVAIGMRCARQFDFLASRPTGPSGTRPVSGLLGLFVQSQAQALDLPHRTHGPGQERQPADDLLQRGHQVHDGQDITGERGRVGGGNPRPEEEQEADGDEERQSSPGDRRIVQGVAQILALADDVLGLNHLVDVLAAPTWCIFSSLTPSISPRTRLSRTSWACLERVTYLPAQREEYQ